MFEDPDFSSGDELIDTRTGKKAKRKARGADINHEAPVQKQAKAAGTQSKNDEAVEPDDTSDGRSAIVINSSPPPPGTTTSDAPLSAFFAYPVRGTFRGHRQISRSAGRTVSVVGRGLKIDDFFSHPR